MMTMNGRDTGSTGNRGDETVPIRTGDVTIPIPLGAGSDAATQQWSTDATIRLPEPGTITAALAPAEPSGALTRQIVFVDREVQVPVRVPESSTPRELPTALIATALLLGLSVTLAVTFGLVNGWTSNPVLLLTVASCLHGAAVAAFMINVKVLRYSIMTFSIIVGLGFMFTGMFYGMWKAGADFLHSTGLI